MKTILNKFLRKQKRWVSFFYLFTVVAGISNLTGQSLGKKEIKDGWQFSQAGMNEWKPATVPGTVHTDLLDNKVIPDPFFRTNEKDLQWIDKVNWEYQTVFEVSPEVLRAKNIILVFYGLDTYADIYLNDAPLFSADNMFRTWKIDIKPYVKQKNTLRIYFHSPINKGLQLLEKHGYRLPAANDQSENGGLGPNAVSIFTRKAPYSYGWDWGPRFVTSGIWKPIVLEWWNDAVINDVYLFQQNVEASKASLIAKIEVEAIEAGDKTLKIISSGKTLVQQNVKLQKGKQTLELPFNISKPRLWWPNGMGDPNLYQFEISLSDSKGTIDVKTITTGLRKVEVIQEPDADGKGKSFYFRINGKKVFAKGANYIPNDAFVTRVTAKDYEKIVLSAVQANMNMLRVWGGGIYEYDIFYDLCDKYGIMLWQDFMFACSMYPGGNDFFESIRQEAIDNVKRLRNHPSIVLWCGNNEIEVAWAEGYENMGWGWKQRYNAQQRKKIWNDYQQIFHKILPDVVSKYTPDIFYWPSSPTAGDDVATYETRSGDIHYWGVWHGLHPFDDFNKYLGRFMSEYGFQSFPEFKTVQQYALPEDYDITSPVMAAHQRSGIGNLRIKQYMADWYRDPKDFPSFLYVSQLLQAEAIKTAIYAHRRNMPYVMGSLYWQINDCWPVASWSSIDYYKRWKALHYAVAKAFKNSIIIPYLKNDTVQIFLATDNPKGLSGTLKLTLMDLQGKIISTQELPVKAKANEGKLCYTKATNHILNGLSTEKHLLYAELIVDKKTIADDILYFVRPMKLLLEKPEISFQIQQDQKGYRIILKSNVLAKNVFLSLKKANGFFSDNYFDLLPGRETSIFLTETEQGIDIEKELEIITLYDSYNN
ncbi:MAG: glycoside hydrolase family 2 protein [Bacteroidales bacterium]|nr:glycoside hydrolase family 2 protein [Bacteroidales bacterium]